MAAMEQPEYKVKGWALHGKQPIPIRIFDENIGDIGKRIGHRAFG
jgi:hypothetical protein